MDTKKTVTKVVAASAQGGRPRHEDRFYARTHIPVGADTVSFFGVWDGTVDALAADFVHSRCLAHHLNAPSFRAVEHLLASGGSNQEELGKALQAVVAEAYKNTDAELLAQCHVLKNHYSSTTSVTVIVAGGIMAIGNLGDSPLFVISRASASSVTGSQVTTDHKPDQPVERARIESAGGSVQYLHRNNNKPFIRGGNFDRRKAAGESAIQLQYSRAFGGKELKPFGLSAEPSIVVMPLDSVEGIRLCSDGISDVTSPTVAATVAFKASSSGADAAAALVSWGISRRAAVGMDSDNCTAMVVSFGPAYQTQQRAVPMLLQSADYPNACTQGLENPTTDTARQEHTATGSCEKESRIPY
jgi:serine/threonine protein phosphatase PrpC